MEQIWGAVIVAVVTLIGNIWVTGRRVSYETRLARDDQTEQRRTKRQQYLITLMERLLEASADFEAFLGKPDPYRWSESGSYELAEIIGKAIAVCLASGDDYLQQLAEGPNNLTRNRVRKGEDGSAEDYTDRNRARLQEAVKRLAELIRDV